MIPADEALISAEIDRAHELAERGVDHAAALAFASARTMCTTLADKDALAAKLNVQWTSAIREREQYRTVIGERRATGRPMIVFADSLGLPRPDAKSGPHNGADATYPFMLVDRLPHHTVNSFCQRFFTTSDVVDLLKDDPQLGVESDVLIHIGLNDTAWRMFLEPDRLSLDLLTPELKDRMVDFAQNYRSLIIRELPEYHYVSPEQYRANLDIALELLARRGARTLIATTILPPVRFWSFTPGLQRNFARYNLILMDAAHRHEATMIDLDRLVWDKLRDEVLLPDGMHLSEAGHALVAEHVASLLS